MFPCSSPFNFIYGSPIASLKIRLANFQLCQCMIKIRNFFEKKDTEVSFFLGITFLLECNWSGKSNGGWIANTVRVSGIGT